MDITFISEWLKTTVPGIILLGAVGSIIATVIILLIRRYFFPALSKALEKFLVGFLSHFGTPAGRKLATFILRNGSDKLQIFYLLQVMKFVLVLVLGTCSFVLFALALSSL